MTSHPSRPTTLVAPLPTHDNRRTTATMMPVKAVRDWLSEYKSLPESELNTYSNTIRHNVELLNAIYDMFEDEVSQEVMDPVCHQLFDFYRSAHPELQRFAMEVVPVMVWAYLSAISHNDKKRSGGSEACLLGIYNLEVIDKDDKPKVQTFTIPTLAAPSVYHEPPSLAALALTENALLHCQREEAVTITLGPLPQVENINAQNRMSVLTYVLSCYNADIANLSSRSHQALCKTASRLSRTGFENLSGDDTESITVSLNGSESSTSSSRGSRKGVQFRRDPRVKLSAPFLLEILNGIYFTMFNGQAREGIQALEDVHNRACYEMFTDVLLVTNAIRNSLEFNPSGQPQDGPMGISIALSPTQGNPAFSKSAITNASFRTKKLPEDIDVPEGECSTPGTTTVDPPNYDDVMSSDQAPAAASGSGRGGESEKSGASKSTAKLTKPLKSIMKKGGSKDGDKGDKEKSGGKIQKRESGRGLGVGVGARGSDLLDGSPHASPRHSMSVSAGLSSSTSASAGSGPLNGDVADPSGVTVQVVRSSSSGVSRSVVDHIELQQQQQQQRDHHHGNSAHRRTPSASSGGGAPLAGKTSANQSEAASVVTIQARGSGIHSKEATSVAKVTMPYSMGYEEEGDEEEDGGDEFGGGDPDDVESINTPL